MAEMLFTGIELRVCSLYADYNTQDLIMLLIWESSISYRS